MKSRILFSLLLFFSVVCFVQCSKNEEIDISQLGGKWNVYNDDPRLSVDGYMSYTFNSDMTCIIYVYDALSTKDTTVNRTYIVSHNNDLITIFDEDNQNAGQYNILKLTSKEMKWEDVLLQNNMTLRKVKE